MRKINSNKAITLIALIITIIVLLILAGVTINMVLGENGLFNKAKTSVAKYENATEQEKNMINQFTETIDSYRDETDIMNRLKKLEKDIELLKPVELYSGNTKGDFTLSQSIDNFKTIEIIYTQELATNGRVKFYSKFTPSELNSEVSLVTSCHRNNGTTDFYKFESCGLTINGTTATRSQYCYYYNANGSTLNDFGTVINAEFGNIFVLGVNGYYY